LHRTSQVHLTFASTGTLAAHRQNAPRGLTRELHVQRRATARALHAGPRHSRAVLLQCGPCISMNSHRPTPTQKHTHTQPCTHQRTHAPTLHVQCAPQINEETIEPWIVSALARDCVPHGGGCEGGVVRRPARRSFSKFSVLMTSERQPIIVPPDCTPLCISYGHVLVTHVFQCRPLLDTTQQTRCKLPWQCSPAGVFRVWFGFGYSQERARSSLESGVV
jgi:hypothetical protein